MSDREKVTSNSAAKQTPLLNNNRFFNREKVVQALFQSAQNRAIQQQDNSDPAKGKKKKSRRNFQDGFQYAIQQDGRMLGERVWQENIQQKRSVFQPHQQADNHMIWSLQKLQVELRASRTRHEQQSKLPSEPVAKPKQQISLYQPTEAPSAISSVSPNQSHAQIQNTSLKDAPQLVHHPSNSFLAAKSANPYSKSAQTGPSSHPVGTHNSYSKAPPQQQPLPLSCPSAASTRQPWLISHPTPSQPFQPRPKTQYSGALQSDEFDDDLDDVLANMDDDALLSSSAQQQTLRRVSSDSVGGVNQVYTNQNYEFDYGQSAFPNNNNNTYDSCSNHGYQRNNPGNGVANNRAAPLCPGHNKPCQILKSRSKRNPGREFYKCPIEEQADQCDFFQWVEETPACAGGFSDSIRSSGQHTNNAALQSYNDISTNRLGDHWSGDTSNGAPQCPGHDRPCKVCTSRTGSSAGRQFYACSISQRDQQCDFFQWVDGDSSGDNAPSFSSNWVQSTLTGAPPPRPLASCKDIHAENRRVFGHRSFRPGQQRIIEEAVSGKDVFVLMPTGGGKSLCYQLPAWCCPGLAVVISPLLSLIQDQVQNMTKLGVQSVFINSSQDYETEQRDITRRLSATTANNGVKLLYLTPEKLRHSSMIQGILSRLYQNNLLSRFVIDEAHVSSMSNQSVGFGLEIFREPCSHNFHFILLRP
jgi:DEAD/DEAH box helicase/GRF zinc finger